MILTVCSSSTGEYLAALADVKDALGITDNGDDLSLTRMIRRASRRIETSLGRTLGLQVYQAVLPAYGRKRIVLPAYPVRAVFRVFDGSDTGSAGEILSTQYRLDAEAGFIERDEGFDWTYQTRADVISFPEPDMEYRNYLVEFSAGYILPAGKDTGSTGDGTTATGPTLEPDIEEACIALVRSMWGSRKRESGVLSKRVGELAITYSEQKGALPEDVEAMLTPYRSVM